MDQSLRNNDNRATSSVIGIVLLVGITVLLATTVGVFALGLGLSETVCNANLGAAQSVVEPVC
ncbi:archaellin/type IV pilin N-terminal domain-containing protein [Halorubrum depositum]|uniref:archaellin/type IV pilin N-terminal domain-containing protein n=1 Tax=Halorubrum depositum TaxID=2583992 RepID=UPI0011A8B2B0|nr:type IV pilin N-terminal domain-containing protein [Halorubrum depositum]